MADGEKQCRICLDGVDAESELGRLIRPCLCKGSISYVHLQCLQRWRNTSLSQSAFFSCPQCHYKYRFARTRIAGLATNPVVVGTISSLIFVALTLLSSFITTSFLSVFQESSPVYYSSWDSPWYYSISPYSIVQELVRAALRILQDEEISDVIHPNLNRAPLMGPASDGADGQQPPASSFIKTFIVRFVIGLPLIGASSLFHMFLSMPFLNPLHSLARYRGSRRRSGSSRDITTFIIVFLLLVGAARALFKVYRWTQSITQKLLMRAEDAIVEVAV